MSAVFLIFFTGLTCLMILVLLYRWIMNKPIRLLKDLIPTFTFCSLMIAILTFYDFSVDLDELSVSDHPPPASSVDMLNRLFKPGEQGPKRTNWETQFALTCMEVTRRAVKNPSSLEYGRYAYTSDIYTDTGQIQLQFRAMNGFGAMLDNTMYCNFKDGLMVGNFIGSR